MRIGVFIEPWINQRAGIAVFTEHFVKASVHSKHSFVTIGSKKMDVDLEHVFIPKWKTSFLNPLRYFGVGKIDLKKYKIDLFIDPAHYSTLGLFRCKRRFVIVHDITPTLFPKMHPIRRVIAQRFFLQSSLNQCDQIITVSDQTSKDVANHFGHKSKLHRIYPGVREFGNADFDNHRIKSLGAFILAVGTIEPRKNHQNLIRAFDRFCITNEDVKLVIVGDKGWKVDIQKLITDSPNKERIDLLGFVSEAELKMLYKSALMSVYVSLYEGFGFPVAEAMKLGCPVITSNLGSMKEIAGETGILVDPNSEIEIADAMLKLANDASNRQKLTALAQARIAEFTWPSYVEELDKAIDRVQ